MHSTLFKTWLLLCMLLPMKTLVLGMCTNGQTRYQTCNNNTWCTNFFYRPPSGLSCRSHCNRVDNQCRNYCEDDKLPCQQTDPPPRNVTVTQNITVITTITVTQTRIASPTNCVVSKSTRSIVHTTSTRVLGTQASTATWLLASLEERVTVTSFYSKCTCTSCLAAAVPLSPSPSQTPVFTVTQHTPSISANRSNTVTMATLGVITGILLVLLVMVIAGWVWTCVRIRSSPSPVKSHNDKEKCHRNNADIKVKPN